MEQNKIIAYFDEEIFVKEEQKYKCASNLFACENDIQSVITDINNLGNIDLLRLQSVLALDTEIIEKLRAYAFFNNSKYYHLKEEQIKEITKLFTSFLTEVLQDIENAVESQEETKKLDEIIHVLKECRGMLIDEDFDLNKYTEMFKKIKPYRDECQRLCYALARYMNELLLRKNNIDEMLYYHRGGFQR